jgi:hypothetical protein
MGAEGADSWREFYRLSLGLSDIIGYTALGFKALKEGFKGEEDFKVPCVLPKCHRVQGLGELHTLFRIAGIPFFDMCCLVEDRTILLWRRILSIVSDHFAR